MGDVIVSGGPFVRPTASVSAARQALGSKNLRMDLRRARGALLTMAALLFSVVGPVEARIPRDRAEVRAFRAEHVCPATGLHRGACPGYHVDHIIPLCGGGPDKKANMQWISKEDHRFKTYIDVRECRKMRGRVRNAASPDE